MKISFTTLACPAWSWEQIVEEAVRLGYDGIELRGVEGEMFLPNARPFLADNLNTTKEQLKSKGLEICCLDTSCSFHDPAKFEAAIAEGKASIDLAVKLAAPYIRVFGDRIPDASQKDEIIARVAAGLQQLGDYAEGKGVHVLLETHGDFSQTDYLAAVLKQVASPAVGVLWDVNHPYIFHGEELQSTFDKLSNYIMHTHLKDSKREEGKVKLCLVGEGEVPIPESISLLKEHGYTGWLSLEWEKKWNPDIEEPEVALPAYIEYVRKFV